MGKIYDKSNNFVIKILDDHLKMSETIPRVAKIVKWYLNTGTPFLLNIAGILLYLYIVNRLYNSRGFETMIVFLVAIVIILLRQINKNLSNIENFK